MVINRLKTKLSLAIALVALLTVFLISFFSNIFVNKQYKDYKLNQLEQTTLELVNSVSLQYSQTAKTWDAKFIHTIGMLALSDGYLLTIKDIAGNVIWDAKTCDMAACQTLVTDMTQQMETRNPYQDSGFVSRDLDIKINQEKIGTMTIQYYSPYFLSKNDFDFINGLNIILIVIGIVSLLISALVGFFVARRLSDPILKTVEITKQIADGNYTIRMEKNTSTKELLELTDSINHLAKSLETQETLRKQLTADVAHEFRTPLTTLQTHTEAMLEGVWEPTPERLQSCHDEIVRISKMVVDLENLAKVENNNLNLHVSSINLYDITSKAIEGFETDIKNKNLNVSLKAIEELEADLRNKSPSVSLKTTEGFETDNKNNNSDTSHNGQSFYIQADPDRIYQVLVNLISNAIKYTPNGGDITITLADTGVSTRLSIKDNGIGISDGDLPFIFERFYRADKSRNRMTGGSGIGLAIVKSIVNAHDGKVSVKSKLGEGSEFIVEFPYQTYSQTPILS